VLRGLQPSNETCRYDYPEVRLGVGVSAWEVRDVAINQTRCLKLVEEGVPLDPDHALAAGERRVSEAMTDEDSGPAESVALASTASAYNWTWWEDVVGIKVNQDRTSIS